MKYIVHYGYYECDGLEILDTKDINDNNIFKFKIANDSNYKLYSKIDMIIGGEYILYIPKTDIIA